MIVQDAPRELPQAPQHPGASFAATFLSETGGKEVPRVKPLLDQYQDEAEHRAESFCRGIPIGYHGIPWGILHFYLHFNLGCS